MPSAAASTLFWIAVVICALAQLALLRSAVAAWRAPAAPGDHASAHRTSELVWATLPALLLALVLAFTWRAVRERSWTPAAEPVAAPAAVVSSTP